MNEKRKWETAYNVIIIVVVVVATVISIDTEHFERHSIMLSVRNEQSNWEKKSQQLLWTEQRDRQKVRGRSRESTSVDHNRNQLYEVADFFPI